LTLSACDAAWVEWQWVVTTTVPALTFIGGLWWNRVDGDRRETRARHAAETAAFEQLQRDTHLKLQDSLRYDLNLWIGRSFEGATYLPR
jgi:hypothetical protein